MTDNRTFDVVFEGGGAKGLVLNGAMEAFCARGLTCRSAVGTSAGSMAATLTAAGYTGTELRDLSLEKTPDGAPIFSLWIDKPTTFSKRAIENSSLWRLLQKLDVPFIPSRLEQRIDTTLVQAVLALPGLDTLFSFIELGGIFTGDGFLHWMQEKLNANGRNYGTLTYSEMFARTGVHLTVVASDTSSQKMLALNHITAPHCPVAWGARMSMSIPFFFDEVVWQPEWGKYRGQDVTGHVVVDGGLISNFPLALVLPENAVSTEPLMGKLLDGDAEPLGLFIDGDMTVPDAPQAINANHNVHSGTLDRIERMGDTALRGVDYTIMALHEPLVVRLPAKGYGVTEFHMSDARIRALLNAGDQAMSAYLDQRLND